MTTFPSLLILTLAALSPLLDAAPAPVCPLAGSSSASLERLGADPTAYQLSFRWNRADIPVDYADFHYRINDGEFMNVRAYDGSTPATEATHAVTLHPGDVLHAMVTYSTSGVGCDVAISEHRTSPPAPTATHTTTATPISCNNIQQNLVHDGTTYNIHTTKPEQAQFVDAHYHVAGSYPVNIRMVPSSHTRGVYELPTPIRGDISRITYYLTFSTGSMQCDTPTFATGIPEEPTPTDQIPTTSTSAAVATGAPRSRASTAMPPAPVVAPAPVDIAPVAVTAPAPASAPAPAPAPAPAAATHTSIGPVAATPMTETIPTVAAPAAATPVEEWVEPTTTVVAAPAPAPADAAVAPPAAVDTPAPVAATPIAETVEATGAAPEPPCAAGSIEHYVGQAANGDMVVAFNAAPGDAPYDKVEIYTLHGDDEQNTPIGTNIAAGQSPPVHLGPGETLVYYITYSRGGVECKSAFFST